MKPLITLFLLVPGLTALLFLVPVCAFMCIRRNHDKRWDWMLAAGVLTLPLGVIVDMFIRFLSYLVPYKMDFYVYRFSEIFLGAPSFHIGRYLNHHLAAYLIIYFSYSILPCTVMAVFSFCLWKLGTDEARHIAIAFVLNLVLALPIYLMFPVCGPAYAFPGFPNQIPGPMVPHAALISAPPNGVPSVHFSTALLVLWFARRWKWGTILAGTHLALIALATLGLGEHYVLDLVIAVPYIALVIWLAQGNRIEKGSPAAKVKPGELVCVPHAEV
jgi:hypothetical protein